MNLKATWITDTDPNTQLVAFFAKSIYLKLGLTERKIIISSFKNVGLNGHNINFCYT